MLGRSLMCIVRDNGSSTADSSMADIDMALFLDMAQIRERFVFTEPWAR